MKIRRQNSSKQDRNFDVESGTDVELCSWDLPGMSCVVEALFSVSKDTEVRADKLLVAIYYDPTYNTYTITGSDTVHNVGDTLTNFGEITPVISGTSLVFEASPSDGPYVVRGICTIV